MQNMTSAINFGAGNSGSQVGINHGTVNTVHQYTAPGELPWVDAGRRTLINMSNLEPSETPPEPSSLIPFGRDTDFVPRGDTLDRIHEACAVPGSRVALVGLGGVGSVSRYCVAKVARLTVE